MRRQLAWAGVFLVLFAVALVVIVGPHDFAWSHGYMIGGQGNGNVVNGHPLTIGDHVQSTYYMWLWYHALVTHSHIPMVDPFQFALTGHTTVSLVGWPLVLLFVPLTAIVGPIAAFNATVVLSFLAAAVCAYLLARRLGLSRAGSTVAGFAFAFAPFRLIQLGHIGTYYGFLVPLILYLAERAIRDERHNVRWGWGFAAAYLSLVASGEFHITLYTTVVVATFVVIRGWGVPRERLRSLVPPAIVVIVGTLVGAAAIYHFVIGPSKGAPNGLTFDLAPGYAPRISTLFHPSRGTEQYDYPGVIIALLSLVAFISALRSTKHRRLIFWLIAVIGCAYFIAMAPAVPPFFHVLRKLPFIGFVRVPGRVLIEAVLAFAVLAGFGVTILERRWKAYIVLPIILVLLVADVRQAAGGFIYTTAGQDVLASVPKDAAVMDLPPFEPGHYAGSRYMLDLIRHPGPRANGYDAVASGDIWTTQRATWALTTLPVNVCAWRDLATKWDFRYVAVHADLFGPRPLWPIGDGPYATTAAQLEGALEKTHAFQRLSVIDGVAVYSIDLSKFHCVSQ